MKILRSPDQNILTPVSHRQIISLGYYISVKALLPGAHQEREDNGIVDLPVLNLVEDDFGNLLSVRKNLVKLHAVRATEKPPPFGNIWHIANQHFAAVRQQAERLVKKIPQIGFGKDILKDAIGQYRI